MAASRRIPFVWGLTAIAGGSFVVRAVYVVAIARHLPLGQDALWYLLVSGPLAHGKGFLAPGPYFSSGRAVATAGYPPLYPAFLALVTRALNAHRLTFLFAGAAAGTVTVVLTGLLGRRLCGRRVGLTAAALAACYPSLIAVDGALMSETVSIPLLLGAVLVAVSAVDRPTAWRFAAAGALFGAMMLARADAFAPALMVLGVTAFLIRVPWPRAVAYFGVGVAGFAIVVVPWVVRNSVRVGTPTVATISSAATIAGANCASTYSGRLMGFWDFACMNAGRQSQLDERRWSSETRAIGERYVRAHTTKVPEVVAVRELRMLGLFHPLSQAHEEAKEGRSYRWQLVAWACWLVVLILGTLGLARLVREDRRGWVLAAVVGSVFVTVALSYGNQRFRTSAEPIMLIGAGVTLVRVARSRLASEPRAS